MKTQTENDHHFSEGLAEQNKTVKGMNNLEAEKKKIRKLFKERARLRRVEQSIQRK